MTVTAFLGQVVGGRLVARDGPVRKKKNLRALSEWVKLKKRMEAGG